jgi:hypothetical protein
LHTCFCIGFECLNLNLCLNSFDWVVFQNRNLSLLAISFPCLVCFWFEPSFTEVRRRPLNLWPRALQPPPPPPLPLAVNPLAAQSAQRDPAPRPPASAADGRAPPVIPDLGSEIDRGRTQPRASRAHECGCEPARLGTPRDLFKAPPPSPKTLARARAGPPPNPSAAAAVSCLV